MRDWSHDLVLGALLELEEPVGSLVRAFPGRAGLAHDPSWIDDWFLDLTRQFQTGSGPDAKQIIASAAEAGELSLLARPPVEASVRLVSLHPRFFRGFRGTTDPIRFEADLVVVEGRNSSGKTSISEGIEWVFTGQLSRRSSGEHGHPTELADCIANQFCPETEQTRVSLTLKVDGALLNLERVLKRDYSTTAAEEPESELFLDGRALTAVEEQALRDRLFAGVHPILMQHNLRRFVHDDPDSRRTYFERLLQIDELTSLIEKAVIGPTTLKDLANPDGGTGLAALRALGTEVGKSANDTAAELTADFRRLERTAPEDVPAELGALLGRTARSLFPEAVASPGTLTEIRDQLMSAQRTQREAHLPLLADLERARRETAPDLRALRDELDGVKKALNALAKAKVAASAISSAQQEVAKVTETLVRAGLLDPAASESQVCPICESDPPSLFPERASELSSWIPLASVLGAAERSVRDARVRIDQALTRVKEAAEASVPTEVGAEELNAQLQNASQRVTALARTALESAAKVRATSSALVRALEELKELLQRAVVAAAALDEYLATVATKVEELAPLLAVHRNDVGRLEEAVGAASRDDAVYRLRERWLEVAGLISGVAQDLAWEVAKGKAKIALDGLRTGLIALRTEIIEDARQTFSDRMAEIWHLLRSDTGAQFSRLRVPPARGKGYKLEFELKALISNGASEPEVDALRVFSESQVNVIGLAAYVTRAELLGHKLLIFDDPVQSMDEEHFRSFAVGLLPSLLDRGCQVVILTHSDSFARSIHDNHYAREAYATLESRASRRKGCYVLEGSRRVSERLKNARKLAEDGDLQGGWRLVRLAIERLYTLAYARANPSFDPESWRNLAAEDMWERGIAELVAKKAPDMSKRLKEILRATVAGAHDKAATSETELLDATKNLAVLLNSPRVGAG